MSIPKKIGRALLFPHIAIVIPLVPVSVALLIYSFAFDGVREAVRYFAYALSAYTLAVVCFRTPALIRRIRSFQSGNGFAGRWANDVGLRVKVSLYGSLLWNTAYAVFQLGLGVYHSALWFYAMAAYYLLLAVMRFFLLRHARIYRPGERMRDELLRYTVCGWGLLVMNLALSVILFLMISEGRTFHHNEITTIAMAAYTFTAFTTAIVNLVKYRRYNSPVLSAAKAVSLAAACVSMLTLEATMLTTFGGGEDAQFRRLMLGGTGAVVFLFIVAMALFMIVRGAKKWNAREQASPDESVPLL